MYLFSIFLETDGANLFPTSKQRAGNSRNLSVGTVEAYIAHNLVVHCVVGIKRNAPGCGDE